MPLLIVGDDEYKVSNIVVGFDTLKGRLSYYYYYYYYSKLSACSLWTTMSTHLSASAPAAFDAQVIYGRARDKGLDWPRPWLATSPGAGDLCHR